MLSYGRYISNSNPCIICIFVCFALVCPSVCLPVWPFVSLANFFPIKTVIKCNIRTFLENHRLNMRDQGKHKVQHLHINIFSFTEMVQLKKKGCGKGFCYLSIILLVFIYFYIKLSFSHSIYLPIYLFIFLSYYLRGDVKKFVVLGGAHYNV